MKRRSTVLVVGVVLLCLSAGAVGQTGYSMSVDDTTDVPDRSIELEGSEYQITEIVQRTSGQSIAVTTTAPASDSEYRVRLRNSDLDLVATRAMTGDGSATIPTDCESCTPGTYVLELAVGGDRKLIKPVVIAGYDVQLEITDSADQGDTVTATVTVEGTELDSQPAAVEVALGNEGGEERRVTATRDSGNTYTADISLDGLDTGTYHVFAGAMSDEYVGDSDKQEVLAISQSQTLEVTQSSDGSTGGGSSGSTGGTGAGSSGGSDTTQTATPSQNGTATATPTTSTPTTETRTATPTTETATATESPTPTDSGIITPNNGTASPTESDGAAPTIPFVVAVVSAVGIWLRRLGR
jgi:hypothetical protein